MPDGVDDKGEQVWSLPIILYRTRRYPDAVKRWFGPYLGGPIDSTLGYGRIQWPRGRDA